MLKRVVQPILLSFTHPFTFQTCSSLEHKRRYFDTCPYNENHWGPVFIFDYTRLFSMAFLVLKVIESVLLVQPMNG